jgi:hypothetical protein
VYRVGWEREGGGSWSDAADLELLGESASADSCVVVAAVLQSPFSTPRSQPQAPGTRSGRGGWPLEPPVRSPAAREFADANSFVGAGVLTPSPQDWTLRSTSSPGSVLGVEDDLRTPTTPLIEEVDFAWALADD